MTALVFSVALSFYLLPFTDTPEQVVKHTGLEKVSLETLAAEFRKLRKIKGHFEGGKWNLLTDGWMGRKHKIMIELGRRLTGNSYKKKDLTRLLGEPDRIKPNPEDDGQTLVYYWRGPHDYLLFVCKDNKVVHSYWWYAFE